MNLNDFSYKLPEQLIAQAPLDQRDHSRLMVLNRREQTIVHDTFNNLDKYLPPTSQVVCNNSKVVPARLLGHKVPTGAKVEIFLIKRIDDGVFEALLRPLKRLKEGDKIEFSGSLLRATLMDRDRRIVKFNKKNITQDLQRIGHMPLPPYIKREDVAEDKTAYQTVYARKSGSVAAPTAGLHFTDDLIAKLKSQGHRFDELTLHVNYGTFKPVEVSDITKHAMHSEAYEMSSALLNRLVAAKRQNIPVVAIGTTSCRVLESVAQTQKLGGETNIFIYPGFSFKMVDHLITNFHLPCSTLLMLVSAFATREFIMQAYQEAIKEKYRFYSYGDAMLIL